MIIFEIIGGILGRIFIDIIFEGILVGSYRLLKRGGEFVKVKIFGFEGKAPNKIKLLEKKLLYKRIQLTQDFNSILKSGQTGVVLEVISEDKVFAEFNDRNGNQIEWNNELVFEIGMNQFKLKK